MNVLQQPTLSAIWREVGPLFDKERADAWAEWYHVLERLEEIEPFQDVNLSALKSYPTDGSTKLPAPGLAEATIEAFSDHPRLDEWRTSLEKLQDLCLPMWDHPDAKRLSTQAGRWLKFSDIIDKMTNKRPPRIEISFTPSLDLDKREERRDGMVCYLYLPVTLTNTGDLPAIGLSLECIYEFTGQGSIKHNVSKKLGFRIDAGQSITEVLELSFYRDGNAVIVVKYFDIATMSNVREGRASIPLIFPHSKVILPNPYLPDLPLRHRWFEPPEKAQGKHKTIVKDIVEDIHLGNGRIFLVNGLRRVGKTTVMQEIDWQLRNRVESGNYPLPVYVDLDEWAYRLRRSGKTINVAGMLYELALASLNAAEALNLISESPDASKALSHWLDENEDSEELTYADFDEFFANLRQGIGRAIVLLLDEFDLLWQMPGFDEAQRFHLISFLCNQQKKFRSFVSAQNREIGKRISESLSGQSGVEVIYNTIKFFDEEEVEKLAQLICPPGEKYRPYSYLALHFIWRLTGGWPALTQLLLHRVVRCVSGNAYSLIEVTTIKQVVDRELLSTNDLAFCQLITKSLTTEAIAVLRDLCAGKAINPYTSVISGIKTSKQGGFDVDPHTGLELEPHWQEGLKYLKDNQIIAVSDEQTGVLRLQVGWLYYLPAIVTEKGSICDDYGADDQISHTRATIRTSEENQINQMTVSDEVVPIISNDVRGHSRHASRRPKQAVGLKHKVD